MAKTGVADIIVPTEFERYAIERTAALSAFVQSGIVEHAPEFDVLAQEVRTALRLPAAAVKGVTSPATRAKLRAELDGLIAHLYGLTEEEFAYILTTFPLVSENVKLAARNAFRDAQNGLIK